MDQDEAFRRIWQAFRTLRQTADGRHDTADWRSHDGIYAVCAIRVPAEILQPSLDALRQDLSVYPFARIHPDQFLHIALQELGFVCERPGRRDEISPARLDEFVSAAAGPVGELPPFDIRLGGANSFQDAAFLDVHDRGRCTRVHTRLRDVAAVTTVPRYPDLPHVTIAHYTAEAPLGNLPASLAAWRDRRFGAFTVTRIEVLTLRLDDPYPPLESYAVFPLGG